MQDWRENNMVEWKKLDDVCTFKRGRTLTAKDAIKGTVPVIAGGQTPSYYHNESNRTGESITVAGSGAYAGFVAYWNQPIFVSDAFTVEPAEGILHKYVFHWLRMNQQRIFETQKGAGVPHVHGKDIAGFVIPIPSLSEQTRIVGILDTFTASIENLKQQIAQRRKQYEYYRDQLLDLEGKEIKEYLSFGNDFQLKARIGWQGLTKKEYRTSGDYKLVTGTDFTKNLRIDFDSCVYVDKERYEQDDYIKLKVGDVLITKDGTLGKVAYIDTLKMPATLNGGVFVVRDLENRVIPKFLMFYLTSNHFKNWMKKNHTTGSIQHLTQKLLSSFTIPVLPKSEQSCIVSFLDTFEASIANLESQLKLREKQYEYYRNKLLTFD